MSKQANANVTTERMKRRLIREISQASMQDYLKHMNDLDIAKRELKEKTEIVDALETALLNYLESGYKQEPGTLRLYIDTKSRKVVAWKEKFAEVMGPKAVEQALQDCVPSETKHVKVGIGTGEK